MSEPLTGGCQCGAIRFRVDGAVRHASICHCRMCQKATGGLFGAFAAVRNTELVWTRGEVAYFRSSTMAQRGFCRDCGTPLTYVWNDRGTAITVGAFDDPEAIDFDVAFESEKAHHTLSALLTVPPSPLANTPEAATAYAAMENFQHPDHDTQTWPHPSDRQ